MSESVVNQILRSTSGYISASPAQVYRALVANGSTSGLWQFRNGSTTGAILFELGSTAVTPAKRSLSVAGLTGGILSGVTFSSKCYLTKTGANQGTVFVIYD